MFRALFAAALCALVSGCLTIGAFNRFTAHDEGAVRVAQSAAYGGEHRQTLDVYAPAGGAHNAPVLVFFYGGGWSSGDKGDYSFVGEAFAAQGFVTVLPDYRLTPEVVFPGFLQDSALALRWVQDHIGAYGGDASRIVLAGHSAGAYNAVMVGLDRGYADAAGFEPARVRGVAGLAGPYAFDFDHPVIRAAFGDTPDRARMHAHFFARADAPALLLLAADGDRRAPVRATLELRDAARAAGASAEARIYERLSHAGMVQALARDRRHGAPVFFEVVAFARAVTEPPAQDGAGP